MNPTSPDPQEALIAQIRELFIAHESELESLRRRIDQLEVDIQTVQSNPLI